ncbi:hypothetical protein KJ966_07350 [bacterium]|nr:hypothetical protein [bacterium]
MKKQAQIVSIIVFFIISLNVKLRALELYSIVHPGCQSTTGLIINVDTERIYLLKTDGSISELPKKSVEYILVFNVLDNPIQQIDLTGSLRDFARKVDVQGEVEYSFTGWPIRFQEELIVFYDIEGKTHLVDIELIQGFELAGEIAPEIRPIPQFKENQFGFGTNLPGCVQKTEPIMDSVQPTRMISDQIKISKFLSVYEKGFIKLDRFQKRTSFYARPYLYNKKTKVGIVVDREDYKEELPYGFPLNFQWPTGSNFGPQGILNIGSNTNEYLPNVEPVFGVKFSGKYHFLSVFFSGNSWAFAYGQKYVIENRSWFKEYFKKRDPDDILVLPQYNQVAMTGLEWGSYSFAAGYYYPIICLQGNGLFREIVTEQSIPIASLSYITPRYKLQFLGADMKFQSNNPSDDFINLIYAEEMSQEVAITSASQELLNEMNSYDLQSQFFRINFDYDITREIQFGLSEVIFYGDYVESFPGSNYELSYRQHITSARIEQEFGDYVSLKGYLNFFIRQFHSKSNDDEEDTARNDVSFTVVVEFIL